mmetsp:Transcript_5699/g.21528  ORF Transcript_5699/g.21528 Transcript_5699/m.21528 type:complete len:312 (-) Transcript_5699:280-1215(-)
MRVEAGVLHGEHPRDLVRLVVVRVPPPGRGDEDPAGGPVAPDRVDDVAVRVDLLAHQRVDVGRRGDGQVQRHRVVPVGSLHRLGRDGVEEGPEDVREGLGLIARLVTEEDAESVALALGLLVRDLLHLREHLLAREEGGFEFLPIGFDPEVVHEWFVVDPVERGAALFGFLAGVLEGALGDGDDEEVAVAPRDGAVLGGGGARAADDVEGLRGGVGLGLDGLADADADEGSHEVGGCARGLDVEAVVDVEGDDARLALLVQRGGVDEDGDRGHVRVGRGAVLEDVGGLGPLIDGGLVGITLHQRRRGVRAG